MSAPRSRRPQRADRAGPVAPSLAPRPATPTPAVAGTDGGDLPGQGIVRASWAGTILYAVVALAATLAPEALRIPFVAVAVGLFVAGCVVFLWAYGIAVGRSRTDAIGIGGLYFLAGSAPPRIRRLLLGSLAAQVVVALVTSSIRIFTPLAFGWLVPMYGLGLCGLWAARYGTFAPRRTR